MKKAHLILLIIAAIMSLFSAYSLAAINQVYDIHFEWYSQYNNRFMRDLREKTHDKWLLPDVPSDTTFQVVESELDYIHFEKTLNQSYNWAYSKKILNNDVLLYCSLGDKYSPAYNIKVSEIAQRGNVVEVKVSINSPDKASAKEVNNAHVYHPQDIVRVDRRAFPVKGKLYFVFKNQYGQQLGGQYFEIN